MQADETRLVGTPLRVRVSRAEEERTQKSNAVPNRPTSCVGVFLHQPDPEGPLPSPFGAINDHFRSNAD